jgi:hypothetical protein
MILFVSTLGIIAFTYYFSVEKIKDQGQILKVSNAKQNLLNLDDTIISTLWQPGSAGTMQIADCGGTTIIQPESNQLTISVNDNLSIDKTVFSQQIGQVVYELPYSSSSETGAYLKGDGQTVTSKSGASLSQLLIARGAQHPEIHLRYRPTVSYANEGLENGKIVNEIRIYIVNLNSSQSISSMGKVPLLASCLSNQLETITFEVSNQSDSLVITSQLAGISGSVSVPVSSNAQGAVIRLEIVVSNVSLKEWIV